MLAVESLIRQRLASIPDVPGGVASMADLSTDAVAGRRSPALFVGSLGHRIDDAKSPGAVRIASRWLVVAAVRNVSDVKGGAAARAEASDLIERVISLLYRWQPAPAFSPLMPVDAPRPEYAAGLLLYPLAWECQHLIERSDS